MWKQLLCCAKTQREVLRRCKWQALEACCFELTFLFTPGGEKRILGKGDLTEQVLHFARHIYSSCFDYRDPGESIYQEGEQGASGNSLINGLVKVLTAAGQNMVENTFKHVNEAQHRGALYRDQECETRVSISCLNRNYSTDVRLQLAVPPTPHIWVWNRLNELSWGWFWSKDHFFSKANGRPFSRTASWVQLLQFELLKGHKEIRLQRCVKFEPPRVQ